MRGGEEADVRGPMPCRREEEEEAEEEEEEEEEEEYLFPNPNCTISLLRSWCAMVGLSISLMQHARPTCEEIQHPARDSRR